jgi:hypothetical protein
MNRKLLFLASGFALAAVSISAAAGTCRYSNGDEESCSRTQILPNTVYVPDKGEPPAQQQLQLERQRQEALAMEEQRRRALILQRPDPVVSYVAPLPGQLATMCSTAYGSCGVPTRILVGAQCWCMDPGSTTMSGTATAP